MARNRGFFRHGFKNTNRCIMCGQEISTQRHHIQGRKNSNAVVELCDACHKSLHPGKDGIVLFDFSKQEMGHEQ